jgi:hypothetical protein
MPTPMQIEDALRRADPPASWGGATKPPPPPTPPSTGSFTRQWTEAERREHQRKLVELLRRR